MLRRRPRTTPLLAITAVMLAGSCSRSNSALPSPTPSLADSRSSQDAFRLVEVQWLASAPADRGSLEVPLTLFVQAYPTDGHSRRARLYLAWLNLQKQDIGTAERWLALARTGATGVDGDLLEIVEAALLIATGEPHRAYGRLKPLDGRLLNADDRMLYFEQMLNASMAAEQYDNALQQILNLATQSARRHRDRTWRRLSAVVATIPPTALEGQLRSSTLVDTPLPGIRRTERSTARNWLLKQIRSRLSRSALANRDVGLAQRLVSNSESESTPEASARLRRLATEAELAAQVVDRRLGFLFELTNATKRQHAVEFSLGASLQLRAADSSNRQRVTLHSHSVQDSLEIPGAMQQLAGEGVSLFVAGLDADSADIAAQFAETQQLPLLLLHPESRPRVRQYVRVVGVDYEPTRALLRRQLEANGIQTIVQLGHPQGPCQLWGELKASQRLAPLLGEDTLKPGLLLSGASACSQAALQELSRVRAQLRVGIGLASYALLRSPIKAKRVWSVGAGLLPWLEETPPDEMRYWFEKRNHAPTWFEALGHDIAVIAEALLPAGPGQDLEQSEQVAEFHQQIVRAMNSAQWQGLWSSAAQRFEANGELKRQFRTVTVPQSSAP